MGIKKISINIPKELAAADDIRINLNCVVDSVPVGPSEAMEKKELPEISGSEKEAEYIR